MTPEKKQAEIDARITQIRTGNAQAEVPIDHSMRKREYWENRPSPASQHHWTPDEFKNHLLVHRYPACTINDRMRHHQSVIREALYAGKFVPAFVLDTEAGKEAVEDAVMFYLADIANEQIVKQGKELSKNFLKAIGWCTSQDVYDATIKELIMLTIEAHETRDAGELPSLKFEEYSTPIWGVKTGSTLTFRSGNPKCIVQNLHSIEWSKVESIVRSLVTEGKTHYDQYHFLMGSGWVAFTRVYSSATN
jgi:hypothetical protein